MEEARAQASLLGLPSEVLQHLLSFVKPWDLCSLSMVCRELSAASNDERLWRPLGNEAWLSMGHVTDKSDGWKQAYLKWLREEIEYRKRTKKEMNKKRKDSTLASLYDHYWKLLPVGRSGIGKTSVLLRFFDKQYHGEGPTLEQGPKEQIIEYSEQKVKIQFWDRPESKRFRSPHDRLCHSIYRGAHAIYIMYDVTNRESFDDVPRWCTEAERYALENVPVILIGNKCDDVENRVVTEDEARKLALQRGMPFFECSAKTGKNVDEAIRAGLDAIEYVRSWRYVSGMAKPAFVPDEATMANLTKDMGKRNNKERCCLQ